MTGREKLLSAALKLFSERGYDAVGIRQIGMEAGLTNPALYQHFSSKLALGEAVYLQSYEQLLQEIDLETQNADSPWDHLDGYIRAAVRLHDLDPSPLLFIEDHQRLFGPKVRELFNERAVSIRLHTWIEEGQRLGQIRSDIPAAFLVGLTIGQITQWAVMADLGLSPRHNADLAMSALIHAALKPQTETETLP